MKEMLHPQVNAVLDLLIERNVASPETIEPSQARTMYLERAPSVQPSPAEVGSVRNLNAWGANGNIPLRIYRPVGVGPNAQLPALIWYHGGGWVIGGLDTHDTLCRDLCSGSGCSVVSVDYRLGPEHKFPAAVDDTIDSLNWVSRNAAVLGIDPDRLAVGGDSAGGNLAAVASILARDAGTVKLACQLLVYPVTDLRRNYPSHKENGEGYVLTTSLLDYFYKHYLDTPESINDWRASPILYKNLEDLPSTLVITAGFDPLRDEGAAYAAALTKAGNQVLYLCFTRQIHGFMTMGKVFDDAYPAISLCISELNRRLVNLR